MVKATRGFQVFVKPTGSLCNLGCRYCYYLEKEHLYSEDTSFQMTNETLERYIVQHIESSPDEIITFSWHGGEPTVLGLDYFRKIVEIQRKHEPKGKKIINGVQTNGTLLDDEWCQFFAKEEFAVGISIDGLQDMHDQFRTTKDRKPTFKQTLKGYNLLQKYKVHTDILCVVNAYNAKNPLLVFRFFKQINAQYITFLPLVEQQLGSELSVSDISVPPKMWGEFLCTVFDEWVNMDIGKVKVQIFEEALRTAFNQEHSLCIFRPTCGDIPVIEHNGDFYSCDHYVDISHLLGNINDTPFVELLDSTEQREFGDAKLDSLPQYCLECSVRSMCNGECPKNRFLRTPDGEPGLNYLCEGYKQFFTHCQPFISEVANLWRRNNPLK